MHSAGDNECVAARTRADQTRPVRRPDSRTFLNPPLARDRPRFHEALSSRSTRARDLSDERGESRRCPRERAIYRAGIAPSLRPRVRRSYPASGEKGVVSKLRRKRPRILRADCQFRDMRETPSPPSDMRYRNEPTHYRASSSFVISCTWYSPDRPPARLHRQPGRSRVGMLCNTFQGVFTGCFYARFSVVSKSEGRKSAWNRSEVSIDKGVAATC